MAARPGGAEPKNNETVRRQPGGQRNREVRGGSAPPTQQQPTDDAHDDLLLIYYYNWVVRPLFFSNIITIFNDEKNRIDDVTENGAIRVRLG